MTLIAEKPPAIRRLRRAPRGPVSIPLNSFQTLMRKWCTLAPYNAGQIMRITGHADLPRWTAAIDATLAEVGLGLPQFSVDQRAVTFHPAPPPDLLPITTDFDSHITQDMNHPFHPGELPLRFFYQNLPDDTHYLGTTYDHWIADSRAMRLLMQRIFARYHSQTLTTTLPRLHFPEHDFYQLFGQHIGPIPALTAVRESFRNLRRHTCAFRINLFDPLDFTAHCLHRTLPDGLIDRIHRTAKSQHASVNDFFLAILSQIMGDFTAPDRYRHRRHLRHRHGVGLGTIVDIRDAAAFPLNTTFGLYLSSYTIVLKEPEKKSLPALVRAISTFTSKLKSSFGTVRAYLALAMAKVWWDLFPNNKSKALLFQKNVPLTAGISNVNLTGAWMDQASTQSSVLSPQSFPIVLDYLRISPTGPLLPIVFTLTTIRDHLSLCVTYRTTAFTPDQAHTLIDHFIQALTTATE